MDPLSDGGPPRGGDKTFGRNRAFFGAFLPAQIAEGVEVASDLGDAFGTVSPAGDLETPGVYEWALVFGEPFLRARASTSGFGVDDGRWPGLAVLGANDRDLEGHERVQASLSTRCGATEGLRTRVEAVEER